MALRATTSFLIYVVAGMAWAFSIYAEPAQPAASRGVCDSAFAALAESAEKELVQPVSTKGNTAYPISGSFESVPAGYQSYLQRPDILKIKPQALAAPTIPYWSQIKQAHLEAIAMMLEMYPEHDLYFLARDMEEGYDLARILLKDHPEQLSRLHLINVSRLTRYNRHLKDYLAQNGLSEESLKTGKKALLVDTGFAGKIPTAIKSIFSKSEFKSNIQTQLMLSNSEEFPSAKIFFGPFKNSLLASKDALKDLTVDIFERLPRFSNRATGYGEINHVVHPLSLSDGRNWREQTGEAVGEGWSPSDAAKAKLLMGDLAAFGLDPNVKTAFGQRREAWKGLFQLWSRPADANGISPVVAQLKTMLLPHPGDPTTEAIARSFIELTNKNLTRAGVKPLTLEDVGIKELDENKKIRRADELLSAH